MSEDFFCANGGEPSEWVKIFLCANDGIQSCASVSEFERKTLRWLNARWWEFRITEFKMAAIIKLELEWMNLSQIELVWIRVRVEWECLLSESERRSQGVWIQDGSGLNPTWQNSRWLPSSSSVRMNEWSFFMQMVGTKEWVKFFLGKWWEPFFESVSEFEREY